MKNVARLTVANARDRNSSSGTSGLGRRAMRIGNRTRQTTPTPSATQAAGSAQALAWPRMTPNARPPTASAATSAPSQSNRPVVSVSRDSCTCVRVAHRAKASSGTLIRNANRQPMVSTSVPPTIGPRIDQGGRRRRPDPERARPGLAVEGVGDQRQRPRDEQGTRRALGEPEEHQQLEGRGQAAQRRRRGEPDEPERIDPATAVVVGQGAGQDEQRGQDRQVAADDVGLALEDRR